MRPQGGGVVGAVITRVRFTPLRGRRGEGVRRAATSGRPRTGRGNPRRCRRGSLRERGHVRPDRRRRPDRGVTITSVSPRSLARRFTSARRAARISGSRAENGSSRRRRRGGSRAPAPEPRAAAVRPRAHVAWHRPCPPSRLRRGCAVRPRGSPSGLPRGRPDRRAGRSTLSRTLAQGSRAGRWNIIVARERVPSRADRQSSEHRTSEEPGRRRSAEGLTCRRRTARQCRYAHRGRSAARSPRGLAASVPESNGIEGEVWRWHKIFRQREGYAEQRVLPST